MNKLLRIANAIGGKPVPWSGRPGTGKDAEKLVAWLREGANELEKAHVYLDGLVPAVPRNNPDTGNPFTLAARIAYFAGVR